jgi:hypothetical protein
MRQGMTMKVKLGCETIKHGLGGFLGEPAAQCRKKTIICDYARPVYVYVHLGNPDGTTIKE